MVKTKEGSKEDKFMSFLTRMFVANQKRQGE